MPQKWDVETWVLTAHKTAYYKIQNKDKCDVVRHPVSTLILNEKHYRESMLYQGPVLQIGRAL